MAQSQLDHYLATLEARLKGLPPARRQEEMVEIRQHLEALVAGHQGAGVSEEAAVAAAIRQFGHAEQIGQELNKASQLPRLRPFFLLLVAILTVVVNLVIFAVNDNPDTWFTKFVLAFSFSAGILALAVAEIVQSYLRTRHKST
ncbi:MAG: hypothetical protein KF832_19125 [Caldilineaceae bacterium]|nr:hypothetical protein [Caldilineaceae bacterium]